jgi:transposase
VIRGEPGARERARRVRRAGTGRPTGESRHGVPSPTQHRRQHHYLTIVADHHTGDVVWADEGKDTAAAERFYDALGQARSHRLRAVSMDMGKAYPKVTTERAPQAVICWDPYHVVALATRELDVVRRGQWNHLRATTVRRPPSGSRAPGGRC